MSGNTAGNKFQKVLLVFSSDILEYVQVIQNDHFPGSFVVFET
jgi:hypothetical protein